MLLTEDGRRVADEVLPELTWLLGLSRRRGKTDQPFLEPLRLEGPRERLLHDEHDAVAPPAQDIRDPDAVVRRPEGPLRKEDDGSLAHAGDTLVRARGSANHA